MRGSCRSCCACCSPISQICLIAFPLACSARYGLSAAVYVSLIVLGIACGPVDLLLFRALDQACGWFDSSSKVNMLQEQLRVQSALRQRSRHERDQVSALRDQLRERLEQARADLRAEQAGKAGESLEGVISPYRGAASVFLPASGGRRACGAEGPCGKRFGRALPCRTRHPRGYPAAWRGAVRRVLQPARQCAERLREIACRATPRRNNRPLVGGCTWSSIWRTATCLLRSGTGGRRSGIGRRRRSRRWRRSRPVPRSIRASWLGQGIVREVARRHDGTFEAGQVDGVYHARVILKQDRAAQDGGDGGWSR